MVNCLGEHGMCVSVQFESGVTAVVVLCCADRSRLKTVAGNKYREETEAETLKLEIFPS